MINLRSLDLNLLVTLDVLLTERNVTRAARRLNYSQPSVSVHLAKLRDMFGDPLLLPGPRGMQATARAEELRQPLREALESLERAVTPGRPFNPAESEHTWRVAASDSSGATILLPAMTAIRAAAPGTRLAVLDLVPSHIAKQAEQGEVDLAFHTEEGSPPGLRRRKLFAERYVLAGRVGHPHLRPGLTLAEFCELEHVMMSPDRGGFHGATDDVLANAGLKRKVVLSVPHFLLMLSVLASTDLVAMLPSRLVRNTQALQVIEPPLDVPGYDMVMRWHERSHRDPAHQWLREIIATLA
ncbi:LysR family transcriptional regulator [Pseudoduganella albidiflava]|uniref:LysR family transcriptional regulator n=1 Tax=Pseudoduganella albidiflava TaxID=321983 RepID=A0A411WX06_9BURK|nr:LysR family transcriptional regulator [Pseudoduganella albidiflava]QBI01311.1 LysR family transcriptional regulator [Pseudoduganella albidiflava]GGY36685.1 LysR family transcriptional regulator [Pseudoduganella albidiflava]